MVEDEMVGWHHDSIHMSLSKLWELAMDTEAWYFAVHGVTKSWAYFYLAATGCFITPKSHVPDIVLLWDINIAHRVALTFNKQPVPHRHPPSGVRGCG